MASLVRGLATHSFQPEQQVPLLASVTHEVCALAHSALEQCDASHHQQQQAQAQAAEGSFNAFANFDSPGSLDPGAQDDSQGRLAQLVPLVLIVGETAAAWVSKSGAPQEPAQSRTAAAGMLEQQPAGLVHMRVSQCGRGSQETACSRDLAAGALLPESQRRPGSACSTLACAILAPAVTGRRDLQPSCVAGLQGSAGGSLQPVGQVWQAEVGPAGGLQAVSGMQPAPSSTPHAGAVRPCRLLIQTLCAGEEAQQAETSSHHSAAADSGSGEDWGEVQEASADAEPTLAAASPPLLQLVCEESLQVCPALAAHVDSVLLTATSAWLHEGPGTWCS